MNEGVMNNYHVRQLMEIAAYAKKPIGELISEATNKAIQYGFIEHNNHKPNTGNYDNAINEIVGLYCEERKWD